MIKKCIDWVINKYYLRGKWFIRNVSLGVDLHLKSDIPLQTISVVLVYDYSSTVSLME